VPRGGRRRREGTRWFADIHAAPQAYHAGPAAVMHPSAWRNCPKSTGSARKVALQVAEAPPFGTFWPRHTDQIDTCSVARTPFRTVSQLDFSHLSQSGWVAHRLSAQREREDILRWLNTPLFAMSVRCRRRSARRAERSERSYAQKRLLARSGGSVSSVLLARCRVLSSYWWA
jgi:hypothetical protein